MKEFPYFIEIWLRGYTEEFKKLSNRNLENFHPHITIVRPFRILVDESKVIKDVYNFCKKYNPIPYTLAGKGNFNGKYYHVPLSNHQGILEISDGLEHILEPSVVFAPKIEKEKHLHVTIDEQEDIQSFEGANTFMTRLTGIKDKKIWFSYDFFTEKVLNREESLDKSILNEDIEKFIETYFS